METLGHTFTLNGTLYTEILAQVVADWECNRDLKISEYFMKRSVFPTIYKAIRLCPVDADHDSYIHTAIQTLRSLTACPSRKIWDGVVLPGYSCFNSDIVVIDQRYHRVHISQYVRKCMWRVVKSGKISKFRRELRLKNLQPGIREHPGESEYIYELNRDLALKLLIPILDLCPKSDKLVAALNPWMRRVCLRYTPQRRLSDAVYKYIRRTSGARIK